MSKKTTFRAEWTNSSFYPSFAQWVAEDKNCNNNVMCKLCKCIFTLSNMGVQALKSHGKGVKHKKAVANLSKTVDIRAFVTCPNQSSTAATVEEPRPLHSNKTDIITPSSTPTSRVTLHNFVKKDEVKKNEILWCMFVVMTHMSLRTAANAVKLFPRMFPDSNVARNIQLNKDKVSYTICFGLTPFFQDKLLNYLRQLRFFTVSFDESLNKVTQSKQMDIIIRYWCSEKSQVRTRFLNSVFLGHSTSQDLIKAFKEALNGLSLHKIFQISMDGPAVNWKFLRELKDEFQCLPSVQCFVDMGSCGLHVIHGAFKTGITSSGWKVVTYLRAIYDLFKNVPARRADYMKLADTEIFPKKFCSVRWLNNANVAERGYEMLPYLLKYLKTAENKKCLPTCLSVNKLKNIVQDDMLLAQLAFFQSLASNIEPFLTEYQSNDPLAPFLHSSLYHLLKRLMSRFVKDEVMDAANSPEKLVRIDILISTNIKMAKNIKIGYQAESAIRKIRSTKSISDITILQFREQCKICLVQCTRKILEKSPLKYKLTMGAACINPENVLNQKYGIQCLQKALEVMTEYNWFSGSKCESIEKAYISFCNNPAVRDMCKTFDKKTDRLDSSLVPFLNKECNTEFVQFVQMLLVLFNGNAAVERGFSVNSNVMIENLSKESLIAQRTVYDAISDAGGIEQIEVTKEMLFYASQAHLKWKTALEKKNTINEKKMEEMRKRKRNLKIIEELKKKRRRMVDDNLSSIKALEDEIKCLEESAKKS